MIMNSYPPIEPLTSVTQHLEREGLEYALGGSGLLVALGLAEVAHDWDLTTDAPLDRVRAALDAMDHEAMGPANLHADHKLIVDDGKIEIIVGFAIRSGENTVRIPTLVTGHWNGLAIGSPAAWAVAYWLLGREAKAELLLGHLTREGAEPRALGLLQSQPLPDVLRDRLSRLSRDRTSSST